MSLNMLGHIDGVFESIPARRISKTGGEYVDGFHSPGVEKKTPHTVTLQRVKDREIAHLNTGARRISDYRKIYINDGVLAEISEADDWEFNANGRGVERYEAVSMDNRPWRNYCRIVVALRDE